MLDRFRDICVALDNFYGGPNNCWRSPWYLRCQIRGMLSSLGVQTEPVVQKSKQQKLREEYLAQEVELALRRADRLTENRLRALVLRRRNALPEQRGAELLDTSLEGFNFVHDTRRS